jgi:DivIVA domain-containing protein
MLTPQEVHAVSFGVTRMHAGYRIEEVDDFLDVVEQTLVQLSAAAGRAAEIEAMLRTQCAQLQARIDHLEQHPVVAGDPDMLMRVARATVDELVLAASQRAEAVSTKPSPAESGLITP